MEWRDLGGLAVAITLGTLALLYRYELVAFFRSWMPSPATAGPVPHAQPRQDRRAEPSTVSTVSTQQPVRRIGRVMSSSEIREVWERHHQRYAQRKDAKINRERNAEPGTERGTYTIDQATKDIMRKAAQKALSEVADKALQKYVNGETLEDGDIVGLLGVRRKTGLDRLEQLRAIKLEAERQAEEDKRLEAEVERVKTLPRVPELERSVPLPKEVLRPTTLSA